VFSQERATGGAARVLPKDTDRRGGGHEIPPRGEPQADSPSRSAGRFARIPVMRHSHQHRQALQSAYPPHIWLQEGDTWRLDRDLWQQRFVPVP
jgi:hypothetical protein